jgi:uncharacterized protein YbjT (DUF2867 family)
MAGASGLVGAACLRRLLDSDHYGRVVALSRRPLAFSHDKLRTEIVDFARLDTLAPVPADDAFCALGTTMARAGSREAFRAVDYHAVLGFADFALRCGAGQFVFISSVGADRASPNFYLHVKGETEAALAERPFRALHVIRPGLLLGERAESRPAEALFRAVAPALNPLLIRGLRQYRAVSAARVGSAMVGAVFEQATGLRTLYFDDILRLSNATAGRLDA